MGSPRISARELLCAALAACALAGAMHWPMPLHLGRDIPGELNDPLDQAWQVAWGGHALAHQPLDFFQANIYWPQPDSLAFTDALVGYAPAGLIGSGQQSALVRYNLLFLFAYALSFLGAYLLARELGCGPLGAAVAGVAFAYAPWRLAHDIQLHVISSGGIPLALFLLVRGYYRRAPKLLISGWLVATWQVLLGFTLGLQLLYLLGVLALVSFVFWFRRRPAFGRSVIATTLAGVTILGIACFALSRPYTRVLDDHPEARRTRDAIEDLPLRAYLAAPQRNLIWGAPTASVRDELPLIREQALFPGLAVLALAGVGLFAGRFPRGLRMGLAAGVLACGVLAMGIDDEGVRLPIEPYRLLYEYAPGWEGVRTPARLNTLTSLGLALLAALGTQAALAAAERRRAAGRARLRLAAGGAIVAVVLAEGAGFEIGRGGDLVEGPPHPRVPFAPAGQRDARPPLLHLPPGDPALPRYVFWSTDGFPAMVNGSGSFYPRYIARVIAETEDFPDRRSVAFLRRSGVRTVILHPDLAAGTAWARSDRKSVAGLPVEREPKGGVVLYRLRDR